MISRIAIRGQIIIILLLMTVAYSCVSPLPIYRAHVMTTGITHLKAIGEIPKATSYDSFFKQVASAGVNGGLTVISSNKEIGNLSMEKIQYNKIMRHDQIMRFLFLITEKDGKYIIDLTQDYKMPTEKETLLRNAVAIFANLQEVSSYKPEDMSITIGEKTLALNNWMKEVFEKK